MLYKESFIETLTILDSLGLLEHVILIGSWAEYLYEQCNVVESFISTTKTMDIDFLVKNIRKPRHYYAPGTKNENSGSFGNFCPNL